MRSFGCLNVIRFRLAVLKKFVTHAVLNARLPYAVFSPATDTTARPAALADSAHIVPFPCSLSAPLVPCPPTQPDTLSLFLLISLLVPAYPPVPTCTCLYPPVPACTCLYLPAPACTRLYPPVPA
eukprot:6213667-Pleurochrysis_carterae.AAC.2